MENVSYYKSFLFYLEDFQKTIAIMRNTLILLVVALCQSYAADSYSQTMTFSDTSGSMPLTDLFSQIEKQSDYLFFYVDEEVRHIHVDVEEITGDVNEVLAQALNQTNLTYTISNRNINITRKSYAALQKQTKLVTGKVMDAAGEPIIGANVVEKGTTNGIITDIDGMFTLQVDPSAILTISYIGYLPQDIPVENRNNFTILLQEDSQSLDEVVVVGYGTARKIDLTGSTSSLSGDKLQMKNSPQLSNQLQGQMAGVQITRSSGDPSTSAKIGRAHV